MDQSTSPAAKKLGIRPGARLTVLGMEPGEAVALLGGIPADASMDQDPNEPGDIVLLFADNLETVRRRVPAAHDLLTPDGRLWVAYRKGKTRQMAPGRDAGEVLHRDSLQRALAEHQLVGVTLIAIDDAWSAMRVRPMKAA